MEGIQKYERLGSKTFIIFLLSRMKLSVIATIVVIGLIGLKLFLLKEFESLTGIIWFSIAGNAIIFAGSFLLAWLEYIHYSISIEEGGGFKVKRGVIFQEELAIPYRRIQQVKVERNPIDQLFGVSSVIVNLLGDADGAQLNTLKVVLPALDKNLASNIQTIILKKAEVDKITMVSRPEKGNIDQL